MRTCPDCHSLVEDSAIFCDNCGFRLSPVEEQNRPTIKADIPMAPDIPADEKPEEEVQAGACSSCGYFNVPGEMFCQNCGVQLAPVVSVPPPPPVPISKPRPPEEPPEPLPLPSEPVAPADKDEAEAGPAPSVTCSNCGFQNPLGETFCQNCGQILEVSAAEEPPVDVEEPVQESMEEVQEFVEAAAEAPSEIPPVEVEEGPLPVVEEPEEGITEEKPPLPEVQAEEETSISIDQIEGEEAQAPVIEGEELEAVPIETPAPGTSPVGLEKLAQIQGRFIVKSSGEEILVPADKTELTFGRTDPVRNIFPDIDLTNFGGESSGVSRMHARLFIKDGELFLEDLNSTNYTFVNRLRLQPGQAYAINDGDEIRLGLFALNYFI